MSSYHISLEAFENILSPLSSVIFMSLHTMMVMAEPHVDETAAKGIFKASFPNDSLLPASSANFAGMERYPDNLSCPCLALFASDFLLFDDPVTSTGACASPPTTLHSKKPLFNEEMELLSESRSDQKRKSSRRCSVSTNPQERKKLYFCRNKGCSRASRGGFNSRSVRDRHQATHDPKIPCAWEGCTRLFSRTDSMKKHFRSMHQDRPLPLKQSPSSCSISQQMPLVKTEQSTHT